MSGRDALARRVDEIHPGDTGGHHETQLGFESTFVSLDGVISTPQVWGGARYWDDEYMRHASDLLFAADALLLGRETYEGFAGAWPARPVGALHRPHQRPAQARRVAHAAADGLNASVIEGDVAQRVTALKRAARTS